MKMAELFAVTKKQFEESKKIGFLFSKQLVHDNEKIVK